VSEYNEVYVRYFAGIVERSRQLKQQPPENWNRLRNYLTHIEAVGDTLLAEFENHKSLQEMLLLVQAFAFNTSLYVQFRRERQKLGWLKMGLEASRALNSRFESFFLRAIGSFLGEIGEKREALEYFEQALQLDRQKLDKKGEAAILNNIAGVYWASGDSSKALEYMTEVLNIH
jgi:tetratricopeptide (TPR) repeat protein